MPTLTTRLLNLGKPMQSSRVQLLLACLLVTLSLLRLLAPSAIALCAALVIAPISVYAALALMFMLHSQAAQLSDGVYPVGPIRAALYLLVPVSSVLWCVWWPKKMLSFFTGRVFFAWLASLLMLISVVAAFAGVLGAVALAFIGVGRIVQHQLSKRGAEPGALSSVPDQADRTVILLDSAWFALLPAFAVTPPDVFSILIMTIFTLTIALPAAWFVLGLRAMSGRSKMLQYASCGVMMLLSCAALRLGGALLFESAGAAPL